MWHCQKILKICQEFCLFAHKLLHVLETSGAGNYMGNFANTMRFYAIIFAGMKSAYNNIFLHMCVLFDLLW